MLALIQRVTHASVQVDQQIVGEIGVGILVFIGIEKTDTTTTTEQLFQRLLHYRIFSDAQDKMNLSVSDVAGGILLVPQFTLAANTQKGLRPSFSSAANPELAKKLFAHLGEYAQQNYANVATGQFAAHMIINLCNDGPVTFLLKN